MRYRFLILFVFICFVSPASSEAAIKIVATIQPLHALASAVTQGVSTPDLLIRGGQSPHSYSLRPADAKKLSEADLVIWVGPELETFLHKPLTALAADAEQMILLDSSNLIRLPQRSGGRWQSVDSHQHEHHDTDGDGLDAENFNPHLWLDPLNGIKIVLLLAERLSDLDPANADQYRKNAQAFESRLLQLDRDLHARLERIHDLPYLVFHDAYAYFEARYHLNPIGAISVSPDRRPGAKRVAEIRETIKESGALCVFSEPQFKPQLISTLISDTPAKSGVLDPLGADLPVGKESYVLLLTQMADNLTGCLDR